MRCTPLVPLALLAPIAAAGDGTFAVRAERVHVGDGTVIENGTVVVRDGRIADVGEDVAVPEGAVLIEHEGDLSPGLVALRDYSGGAGENLDSTRVVFENAEVAHAFDPDHADMKRLLAEGVTTVVLAPASGSLVGGLCAVVKPGARVLERGAMLHVDLGSSALVFNRHPTSYAGALAELERRFAAIKDPGDPEGAFARAARGELPVLLEAGGRAETQRAIDFAVRHGLKGVLVGAPRAGELAAQVKAAGLAVAVEPFRAGANVRTLRSAAQLVAAGVPIGFALDAPAVHPSNLRLTAAACVRAGLDRDAALGALTSGAAALAGVGDRVGSIAAGRDADFVLWSGDPVDPGSRVLAVYVDGEKVHEGDFPEGDDE